MNETPPTSSEINDYNQRNLPRHGWVISGTNKYCSARYYAEETTEFFAYTLKINLHGDRVIQPLESLTAREAKTALSDLFADVLEPTDEEMSLFLLDYGIEYPTSTVIELNRLKTESEG